MRNKGKLITFEGIDGSGSETQSQLISDCLRKLGKDVVVIEYPDYKRPLGQMIDTFLHGEQKLSVAMQFILYAADMIYDREKIVSWLEDDKTVLSSRYFGSTLAFQCYKGFDERVALRFANDFGIVVPDVNILLTLGSEESARRKLGEKGDLDLHESDDNLLANVNSRYIDLATRNVFGSWQIVDGQQSIESVKDEIIAIVMETIN